jgi:hypothetical protein
MDAAAADLQEEGDVKALEQTASTVTKSTASICSAC